MPDIFAPFQLVSILDGTVCCAHKGWFKTNPIRFGCKLFMYSFIGAFWMHLWEIDKNVGKGIGRCTSLRATWRSLERGWTKQLDWGENLLCIWHLFCICIYCITTYICYFLPKKLKWVFDSFPEKSKFSPNFLTLFRKWVHFFPFVSLKLTLFQKRGSFRSSCPKLPHFGKE